MSKKKKPSDFQPKTRLPHVQIVVTKERPYYYYRRKGFPGVKLPQPDTLEYTLDQDFVDAWRDLETQAIAQPETNGPGPGTVDAMIADFKASPEWDRLAPRTKSDYDKRGLSVLSKAWGKKLARRIERHHGLALRNKFKDQPRNSKYVIQVANLLWNWAIDNKPKVYGSANPFAGIKSVPQGEGFKAWTEDTVETFLASNPPARLRWAVLLALHTGQRRGDLVALRWEEWDGTGFTLTQNKRGAALYVPVVESFQEEMATMPRQTMIGRGKQKVPRIHKTVLVNSHGRAWTESGLGGEIAKYCKTIGLAGYSLHGLRKLATSRLLDAGCTKEQVKAITGHKTDAMVDEYDKAANQKRRATAAVLKLEPRNQGQKEQNESEL